MEDTIKYIESNEGRFLEELKEFLRIPSISTNPENKEDVKKAAEFVKNKMEAAGLENVEIFETKGHPVVYGDWLHAGDDAVTVLVYGHYDVQPVDPLNLWTDPPFEPTIKGDKIYARGSTDDKGQFFIHIKSIESVLQTLGKLPVNVKVISEGEEEIGSEHLDGFIKENLDKLKCDYVVVSDTSMHSMEHPSICYGLRGLCYMEINLTGPNRDLHSGSFGGAVDNPINALAHIISKLKDEKGKILIPGFYDDVRELTTEEREEYAKIPFDDEAYKKDLGVDELFGEEGYSTPERDSGRPTLDANGIWGGFQGEGAKTVLPSKAGAKISMRLVPDQDPHKIEKLFIDYVKSITPKTMKVEIKGMHHAKPAITPIDTEAMKAAVKAMGKAFGKDPIFMREGGSIPVVETFQTLLGAPTILLGFGLPTENTHSPNENFDIRNFYNGIKTIAYYYDELSKINNNHG